MELQYQIIAGIKDERIIVLAVQVVIERILKIYCVIMHLINHEYYVFDKILKIYQIYCYFIVKKLLISSKSFIMTSVWHKLITSEIKLS